MPRPAKPYWNQDRHQWYANIGPPDKHGRRAEKFAPKELGLGPRDEGKAWEWMRRAKAAIDAEEAPVDGASLTVSGLVQLYLKWAEGKRDEDKLSAGQYENKGYNLRRLEDHSGDRPASTSRWPAARPATAASRAATPS